MSEKKEDLKFDKFMKDIVKREETTREHLHRQEDEPLESPQRRLDRLYRERWQNRIKWPSRNK